MWTPTHKMLESIWMTKHDDIYGLKIVNKWSASPYISYRKQWMSRKWIIIDYDENEELQIVIPFYPKGLDQVKTMILLLTK